MLSQIDPSLISFCDKIAAQGGPIPLPNDMRLFSFPPAPVVQQVPAIGTGTQRNVQPEVNFSQSYESLKISKKSCDPDQNQAGAHFVLVLSYDFLSKILGLHYGDCLLL